MPKRIFGFTAAGLALLALLAPLPVQAGPAGSAFPGSDQAALINDLLNRVAALEAQLATALEAVATSQSAAGGAQTAAAQAQSAADAAQSAIVGA